MVVFIHVHQSVSLHNRCFMSQVKQMQHFAQSLKQVWSMSLGRRKIKRLLPVHHLALLPTYAHKYWLTAVMSKGPIKPQSIVQKLSPSWLPETLITTWNTGNKCEGKITFNNVRLSAARVRLARSEQTQWRERKEGKCVVQTNSKVTSLWDMFGLSTLNLKKLVNQAFS